MGLDNVLADELREHDLRDGEAARDDEHEQDRQVVPQDKVAHTALPFARASVARQTSNRV